MALFAVTGTYSPPGLRALAALSARQMEADIAATAEKLGGRLLKMFFVGGTFTVTAIFDLPGGLHPSAITVLLLDSGMVQPGAEIVRLLTMPEVEVAVAGYRNRRAEA